MWANAPLPRRDFDDTELMYRKTAWTRLTTGVIISETPNHLVAWLFAWEQWDNGRGERDDATRSLQRHAHYHGFMANLDGMPKEPQ